MILLHLNLNKLLHYYVMSIGVISKTNIHPIFVNFLLLIKYLDQSDFRERVYLVYVSTGIKFMMAVQKHGDMQQAMQQEKELHIWYCKHKAERDREH